VVPARIELIFESVLDDASNVVFARAVVDHDSDVLSRAALRRHAEQDFAVRVRAFAYLDAPRVGVAQLAARRCRGGLRRSRRGCPAAEQIQTDRGKAEQEGTHASFAWIGAEP